VDCYCSAKSTIKLDRTGPSGPERRRRWSTTEKLRIVEESLATGAVTSEWHADTMSIPTSFMPGGDMHGAVCRTARCSKCGRERSGIRRVSNDTARNSPPKHVKDAPVVIDLVLRKGRILRLPEGVPPARAAALPDALEGLAR
jgi:transposase-like protein